MITDHLHAGLVGYLERKKFHTPPSRLDGAVVLSIDSKYRIYCRIAPHGDLVIECKISDLPEKPADIEDMLRTTLIASHLRLCTHSDVPVLSKNGFSILIQQRIPADATVDEFEGSLENFINSLADWRRIFRVL